MEKTGAWPARVIVNSRGRPCRWLACLAPGRKEGKLTRNQFWICSSRAPAKQIFADRHFSNYLLYICSLSHPTLIQIRCDTLIDHGLSNRQASRCCVHWLGQRPRMFWVHRQDGFLYQRPRHRILATQCHSTAAHLSFILFFLVDNFFPVIQRGRFCNLSWCICAGQISWPINLSDHMPLRRCMPKCSQCTINEGLPQRSAKSLNSAHIRGKKCFQSSHLAQKRGKS